MIKVPLADQMDCIRKMAPSINVTDQMFCAGDLTGDQDICIGDSGGPLVLNNTLAGIVLLSKRHCTRIGKYGLYVFVPGLRHWILSEIIRTDMVVLIGLSISNSSNVQF